MTSEEVAGLIRAGLPGAQVEVWSDDEVHFATQVVTEEFEGLSLLQRHRLINRTLGERMGGEIHSLEIRARTPAELAAGR